MWMLTVSDCVCKRERGGVSLAGEVVTIYILWEDEWHDGACIIVAHQMERY